MILYKRAVAAMREVKGDDYEPPYSASRKGIQSFVDEIGEGLAELGLQVIVTRDETKEGNLWICLVNSDNIEDQNDVTKLASDLSSLEVSYFRRIISEVIEQSYPANSVSSVQALNIAGDLEPTPIPKSQAQEILAALVSRGWLSKSTRSRYTLGTRSLIELGPWLKSTFGDPEEGDEEDGFLKECVQCNKLLIQGLKCPGRDCLVHVHLFCFDKLISANRHQCKNCKISWRTSEPTPVGEDAIPRREDDYATTRRSKKRRATGGAASNGANEEEDELEDEEDEGGPEGNGSRNQSQMVDLESEEEEDERPAQRVRRR
ncbi:hypothetical protein QFC21_005157 [Naganishia friedmannii]|uniref:Uncharacterized protein n=1 Tax=Naganishia friedmannii TaxID=89922 RepID=A0ACC2VAM5_9TREE|nr:hypothetical protein QFC21_005157 [Naganishia friedmannii]